MIERKSYIGKLNGISGIWCDYKPEGIEVTKEITFYTPDEGKIFVDKAGNMVDNVVVNDDVKIEDYVEIVDPRTKEDDSTAE